MRHLLPRLAVAAVLTLALSTPAAAQSDILLRLRSGTPSGDRVRVDSAGGFVALGEIGIGIIPASGNASDYSVRMMWHPYRGAFRAGNPGFAGSTAWDDANIGFYSWAGGNQTQATQFASFAFGDQVTVTAVDAAAFGGSNTVSGTAGFSTGAANHCSGFGCVAMGFTNTAGGQGAVAIGYRVTADADYAVALGHRASANGFDGTFVIADQSANDSLEATATNQFSARYAGGYRLYTNSSRTTGVYLNAGGGSWSAFSDRNHKELFLPVDGEDVLARIRSLPVSTWRYLGEQDRAVRHMGPMAQDWQRAFGFSADTTTINSGDFDGVNLAGIQALEARTTAQAARIRELEAEVARLREQNALAGERMREQNALAEARMREQEARLRRLEALLPPEQKP